jgi:hypothetical protein
MSVVTVLGSVCRLYFDLEFEHRVNETKNGSHMTETYLKVINCVYGDKLNWHFKGYIWHMCMLVTWGSFSEPVESMRVCTSIFSTLPNNYAKLYRTCVWLSADNHFAVGIIELTSFSAVCVDGNLYSWNNLLTTLVKNRMISCDRPAASVNIC